jgi:cysteine desulfurase family protein (TIGR01976 family)
VRAQFPGLACGFSLFDNAGGSQVAEPVLKRIDRYLRTSNVQLGASYEISRLAAERVEEGAAAIARLFGASDPSEIVLGPSTTRLLRDLAQALGPRLREGDEVVVTDADHEANIGAWLPLERQGIVIRFWNIDRQTLRLRVEDLAELLTERTRLVCFTHVSNVLGTLAPLDEITRLVHERDAQVCVDGVAYAPHRRIDVRGWDVDYYVCSLYKVYGPHQAALYGKRELLLDLPGINHYFVADDELPYKLQPGSVSYEHAYASAGIVDYLETLGACVRGGGSPLHDPIDGAFSAIRAHETRLAERLLGFLNKRPGVRIIGDPSWDPSVRVPTVSFVVEGRDSGDLVGRLDPFKVAARYGDFYSRRLIDALDLAGCSGVVRISMVHYNTLDEVESLIDRLDGLL